MAKPKPHPTGGGNRHPASLANLNRGVTPGSWGPGEARALKHGARSRLPAPVDETDLAEVRDAIAAAAPVRDATGELPAADETVVEIVARALKRARFLSSLGKRRALANRPGGGGPCPPRAARDARAKPPVGLRR